MTNNPYCTLIPLLGSKSLPVPTNRYCFALPMLTVAIDENIGGSELFDPLPVLIEYRFSICVIIGAPLAFRFKSKRQILPSRSPRYAFEMKRESEGPVATGSACSAFLSSEQVLAAGQLSAVAPVSPFSSLPTLRS